MVIWSNTSCCYGRLLRRTLNIQRGETDTGRERERVKLWAVEIKWLALNWNKRGGQKRPKLRSSGSWLNTLTTTTCAADIRPHGLMGFSANKEEEEDDHNHNNSLELYTRAWITSRESRKYMYGHWEEYKKKSDIWIASVK